MNVIGLQSALVAHGETPGPVDGVLGARTYRALVCFLASRDLGDLATGLAAGMAVRFGPSDINTRLRIVHFLAQAAHETAGFRYLSELGGPAYFARYDGRADLGNVEPGDGGRFAGRGIFQITGRANYKEYGRQLGIDLIENPELAARPDVAVATACFFWEDHGLNALADADHIIGITRAIDGGLNGLADRQERFSILTELWPDA